MAAKYLQTISYRILMVFIGFGTVIYTTQFFGADGRGEIGLFLLNITLIQLFSLAGGSSLVFLTSRVKPENLLLPSYFWAIGAVLSLTSVFTWFGLSPAHLAIHLGLLGLMETLSNIHLQIILGNDEVKKHNQISLWSVVITLLALIVIHQTGVATGLKAYIMALYVGKLYQVTHSLFGIYNQLGHESPQLIRTHFFTNLKRLLGYGWIIQLGNIAQMLNYRFAYWVIERQPSAQAIKNVGIYATSMNVIEAVWVLSRSISMVQYATISNQRDDAQSRTLTVALFKVNVMLTMAVTLPLLLVPSVVFDWIFGMNEGFGAIRDVMGAMFFGIIANAGSGAFSHYFSGIGRYGVNLIASSIGLLATVIFATLWIPAYGIVGAGYAGSFAYSLALIFQLIVFFHSGQSPWNSLLVKQSDLDLIRRTFRKYLPNRS